MRSDRSTFLDNYLPYLLRRVDQTLSAPFYAALTDYGVARSEWRVLSVLHEMGDMPVVDLAAAALSPQPTVTHALSRLEKRSLVARTQGEADKRQRFVAITPAGKALAAELIDHAKQLERNVLADAGDLSALIGQIRSLTAGIETRLQTLSDNSDPISSTAETTTS